MDTRFVRDMWCPWCGKRHADEGEFATREHHTHLCVDDVHGPGCGGLWRLDSYVFGSPSPAPHVSDELARDSKPPTWIALGED
jgi:hypothetical protein